jgi:hypothetical protein
MAGENELTAFRVLATEPMLEASEDVVCPSDP